MSFFLKIVITDCFKKMSVQIFYFFLVFIAIIDILWEFLKYIFVIDSITAISHPSPSQPLALGNFSFHPSCLIC